MQVSPMKTHDNSNISRPKFIIWFSFIEVGYKQAAGIASYIVLLKFLLKYCHILCWMFYRDLEDFSYIPKV